MEVEKDIFEYKRSLRAYLSTTILLLKAMEKLQQSNSNRTTNGPDSPGINVGSLYQVKKNHK